MQPARDLPYLDAALWVELDIRLDGSGNRRRFACLLFRMNSRFAIHMIGIAVRGALEGPCHGGCQNFFCASRFQDASALRKRSSGRHDVIHQNDDTTTNSLRITHPERVAHRLNGVKTFSADRNAGDIVERSIAESAVGREENRENAEREGLQGHDEDGT
jgi:hypothetical protein